MNVSRPVRVAAIAAFAVIGLSACASTPSAQRVALDVVDGLELEGLDEAEAEAVKSCMRDQITQMSNDDFQEMAEAADANDLAGQAQLTRLETSLANCRN